jgi:hypothetical protein
MVALATVADARTPTITQESIAGAKLGLSARTYEKLIGKHFYRRRSIYRPGNRPAGRASYFRG